jgi:hypothetical protein
LAKGPNSRPDKGFLREIAKAPVSDKSKSEFTWSKPVVKAAKAEALATPHRMREFKSVKESKTNIVSEQRAHIKRRRGES